MARLKLPVCPGCGADALRLEERFEAKEIGTFSIAGAQPKVVAKAVFYIVCDACEIEAKGHYDPAPTKPAEEPGTSLEVPGEP